MLLRKTFFRRNFLCCHEALKTQSIPSVFWTAVHAEIQLQMVETCQSLNIFLHFCIFLHLSKMLKYCLDGVAHTFLKIVGKAYEL